MRNEFSDPLSGPRRLPEPQRIEPERRMTDIVAELWENAEVLVRKELELSISELERKADDLKGELTLAAIGGGVAYAGALAFVAAAILLLSKAVDPWLAALLVGAVVTGSGYAMLMRGKHQLEHTKLEPVQTERSLKRTAHTVKEAVHDARSR